MPAPWPAIIARQRSRSPGSSGRVPWKLRVSRTVRQPRLPLDARRAAPLPDAHGRRQPLEHANTFRESVVTAETTQEQGFLHAPTPVATPKRAGEPNIRLALAWRELTSDSRLGDPLDRLQRAADLG